LDATVRLWRGLYNQYDTLKKLPTNQGGRTR
jgi:hypothetical protein